jgi:hypothetical protein
MIGLLGKMPAISDPRTLMMARFIAAPPKLPTKTNFWPRRKPFPLRTFGNLDFGCCTRASQALTAMRMERLETGKNPVVSDEEVVRVYKEMTTRLYHVDWDNNPSEADRGGFEMDALSSWRKPDETFRDSNGNPLTIDAFLRINQADVQRVKEALVTAGAHMIKVCFNLPLAFQSITPPKDWDIPEGQPLIGPLQPGSWGGHSMACRDYDEVGVWLVHSWNIPDQRITWRAFAAYCDESYLVIDSIDTWRKRGDLPKKVAEKIKSAVNEVSDQKLK